MYITVVQLSPFPPSPLVTTGHFSVSEAFSIGFGGALWDF